MRRFRMRRRVRRYGGRRRMVRRRGRAGKRRLRIGFRM